MTQTEQLMLRAQSLLSEVGQHVFSLLSDPAQRTYWGALLVALVVAAVVGRARPTRPTRWWGASARVDYGLILSKPLVGIAVALPAFVSTLAVAMLVLRGLRDGLGVEALRGANPTIVALVYTVALFVAWDASRFALHWLMHRVDALWQFHQVHHSAETLTPFTLYRVHPVESVLYRLRGVVVTGVLLGAFSAFFGGGVLELELLGINAIGLVFSFVSGNLRHSHVWWSFGRLERWFLSPAQHQMHHAADEGACHHNLGTWLSIWDRAASTFQPATRPPEAFGIAAHHRNHNAHSVLSALIDPVLAFVASCLPRTWKLRGALVGTTCVGLALGVGDDARAASSEPVAEPTTDPDASASPDADADEPDAADGPDPDEPAAPDGDPSAPSAPDDAPEGGDASVDDVAEPDGEADPDEAAEPVDPPQVPTQDPPAAPAESPEDPVAPQDASEDDVDFELGADDFDDFVDEPGESTTPADGTADERDPSLGEDEDAATARVTIIGEAEELPRIVGSAHSVDEEVLERQEHDDIHQLLQSVPGVYVRGEDGYGLRPNIGLRGADPNRSAKITLMEDGVLFGPAPYAAPAAYYFPMTTRLTGLEVFKGPAAVRFGPNTIGGAINLRTREIPQELETGIDVAGGTYGYGKVHGFVGKSWKRFGVLAEGVRVQTNGFKELDGGGDTGFGKNEFMLKARVHGDPGARVYQQFDVKLGLSTERSNETYLGLTDEDFDANPYRRYRGSALDEMSWWRTQAEGTYFLAKGIVEFQSVVYRHDFSRGWRKFNGFVGGPDPYALFSRPEEGSNGIFLAILKGEEDSATTDENLLIGTNQRTFVSQGWQNTVRISPKTRVVDQVIEVGARLHHDSIRRNHDEERHQMLNGTLVSNAGEGPVTTTLNKGQAVAGAFHVVDEIRIAERFTVSPGARLEVIHTNFRDDLADTQIDSTDVVFLPGIGAHVQIVPWLGALAGVHSGFSPKAPGQTDDVTPERSINYEAGFRAGWKGLRAEAIAFVNDYSNLTGECNEGQGCRPQDAGQQFNAGEVLVAGSELLAGYAHTFRAGAWLDATATHTFTSTTFQSGFDSENPLLAQVEEGDAVPYVPVHVASLQLAGGMRRWGTHAQLQYTGEMRDVPGQGEIPDAERIDRFVTLDVGGNFFVTPRAQLYLNLGNVTASRYMVSRRPFGARPGRRFSVIGGFKYNFG